MPETVGGFPAARFDKDMHGFLVRGNNKHEEDRAEPVYVLAMEALGDDLGALQKKCRGERLSLKSVLGLAEQMIALVRMLHSVGIVHRDIKPENFCVGRGSSNNRLYLIDFGLAIPPSSSSCPSATTTTTGVLPSISPLSTDSQAGSVPRKLVGSVRYLSVRCHDGVQATRRDDLESIAYVLLQLLRGSLPWQGLRAQHGAQAGQVGLAGDEEGRVGEGLESAVYRPEIKRLKEALTPFVLAKECPALGIYLERVRALDPNAATDSIDYSGLSTIFSDWRRKRGLCPHVPVSSVQPLPFVMKVSAL